MHQDMHSKDVRRLQNVRAKDAEVYEITVRGVCIPVCRNKDGLRSSAANPGSPDDKGTAP